MSGLSKWRLSFYSSNKTKHLKKFWLDCKQIFGSKDNIILDEHHLRVLSIFLDAVLNSIDFQHQTSNLEEIVDEIPTIYHALCQIANKCSKKLRPTASTCRSSPNTSLSTNTSSLNIEEGVYISEVLNKILLCLELFCGSSNNFKPSPAISDKILLDFDAIRDLFDVFDDCIKSSHLILVARLIRFMTAPRSNMQESLSLNPLVRVSEVISRNNDPAVVSQALGILRSYSEFSREQYDAVDKKSTIRDENISDATGPSGLNLAYQLMGDLLRFAPSWFGSEHAGLPGNGRRDIGRHVQDHHTFTEAQHRDLVADIVLSSEAIYVEREQKVLDLLYPDRRTSQGHEQDMDDLTQEHDLDDASFDGDEGFGDDIQLPVDLAKSLNRRDCIIRIVLLGLEQSQTQSQGIDIFKSIESIVIGRDMLREFFLRHGWIAIVKMLMKIEENIILLQPCMNESQAIARGEQRDAAISSSPSSNLTGDIESKYYGNFTSFMLNLFLGRGMSSFMPSPSASNAKCFLYPMIPALYERIADQPIRNLEALSGISDLLLSGHPSIIVSMLRCLRILLLADNSNIIYYDICGISETLMMLLASLVLSDRLPEVSSDTDTIDQHHILYNNSRGLNQKSYAIYLRATSLLSQSPTIFYQILHELLGLLQICAVIKSFHNVNIPAYYLALIVELQTYSPASDHHNMAPSTASAKLNGGKPHHPSHSGKNGHRFNCQYCESDAAKLECIQCARDGLNDCFRLCSECDRVFHKASAKRFHIRIPLHPSNINYIIHHENKPSSLETISLDKNTCILTNFMDDKTKPIMNICIAMRNQFLQSEKTFKSSSSNSNTCTIIDEKQIIVLSSLRGLLDDRAARKQHVPILFIEPITLLIKLYMLAPSPSIDDNRSRELPLKHSLNRTSTLTSSYADYRDDMFSTHADITSNNFEGYDNLFPPEAISSSEQRIAIVLLLQCMARIVHSGSSCYHVIQKGLWLDPQLGDGMRKDMNQMLNDCPEYHIYIPKESRSRLDRCECISLLRQCGVVGLLVMLFVSEKIDKQRSLAYLNTSDRQYTLWLMREVYAMASECSNDDSYASSVLSWWFWLLNAKIQYEAVSTTTGATIDHATVTSIVPLAPPVISSASKMMLLQELNVLLSSKHPHLRVDVHENEFHHHIISSATMSMIPCSIPIMPIPTRNSSFEQLLVLPPSSQHNLSVTMLRQAVASSYGHTSLISLKSTKKLLSDLNMPQLLARILFGDLCRPQLQTIFQLCLEKDVGNRRDVNDYSIDHLSDHHIEEWWTAFSTWMSMISNNHDAKVAMRSSNSSVSIDDVVKLIVLLARIASILYPKSSKSHKSQYSIMLLYAACELFVVGSFDQSSYQPAMISCRLPNTTPGKGDISMHDAKVKGAECLGKHDHLLFRLFRRNTLTDLRVASINILSDQSASHDISADDMNIFAPVHYIRTRALAYIVSITRPSSLMLFDFLKDDWIQPKAMIRPSKSGDRITGLKLSRSNTVSSEPHHRPNAWSINNQTAEGPTMLSSFVNKSAKQEGSNDTDTLSSSHHPLNNKKKSSHIPGHTGTVDSDNWEIESAMTSTVGGDTRGSQHSYHSLAALSTALFQGSSTSPPSMNGDSTHSHNTFDRNRPSFVSSTLMRSQSNEEMDSSTSGKQSQMFVDAAIASPFPPVIHASDDWESSAYCPTMILFSALSSFNHSSLLEVALLLVHNQLLIRFGLTPDMLASEDEYNMHRPPTFADMPYPIIYAAYKVMLKKHLVLFTNHATRSQGSLNDAMTSGITNVLVNEPNYSTISIADDDCARRLLNMMVQSNGEVQLDLVRILSSLASNPKNASIISQQEFIVFSLINDFMSTATDTNIEHACFHFISKVFNETISLSMLEKLIARIEQANVPPMKPSSPNRPNRRLISSSWNENSLIMKLMSEIAMKPQPARYFSTGNSLYPNDNLSTQRMQVDNFPCQQEGVSLCIWLRPRSINSSSGIVTHLQTQSLSGAAESRCADIFFRSVHHGFHNQGAGKGPDGGNMSSGISTPRSAFNSAHNASGNMASNGSGDHRTHLQLCLAYSDGSKPVSCNNSPVGKVGTYTEHQSEWLQCIQHIANAMSMESMNSSYADDFKELFSHEISGHGNDEKLLKAVNTMCSTVSRLIVPDVIVDYEWTDMNTWHLICFTIKLGRIECYIDGIKRQLLHWTPFGYEYDMEYRQQQEIFDDVLNKANDDEVASVQSSLLKIDTRMLSTVVNPLSQNIWCISSSSVKLGSLFHDISATSPLIISIGEPSSGSDFEFLQYMKSKLATLSNQCDKSMHDMYGLSEIDASKCESIGDNHAHVYELSYHILAWLTNAYISITNSFYGDISSVSVLKGVVDVDVMMRFLHSGPSYGPQNILVKQDHWNTGRISVIDSMSPTSVSSALVLGTLKQSITESGGFKIFYPLLARDYSNQSFVVKIICDMVSRSSDAFNDKWFISSRASEVLVYCLRDPNTYTIDSIQVLLDSAVYSSRLSDQIKFKYDRPIWILHNTYLLRVIIDVAISHHNRIDVASRVMGWLFDLCDEQPSNSRMVLGCVNPTSLMIILSMWCVVSVTNDIESAAAVSPIGPQKAKTQQRKSVHAGDPQPSSQASVLSQRLIADKTRKDSLRKETSIEKASITADEGKLQVVTAKLLRCLLASNDLKFANEISNIWTASFLGCTSYALICFRNSSPPLPEQSASQPSESTPTKKRVSISLIDNSKSSEHRYAIFLSAAVKMLGAVTSAINTGHNHMIMYIFKSSFASLEQLWFPLLEMLDTDSMELKALCIELIILSFSNEEKNLDIKTVAAFDKLFGFHILAESFSSLHAMNDMEEKTLAHTLMKGLFWRDGNKRRRSSKDLSSATFPSLSKQYPETASSIMTTSQATSSRNILATILEGGGVNSNNSTIVYKPKEEGSSAAVSGGLMSLFTWSSANSTSLPSKSPNTLLNRSLLSDGEAESFSITNKIVPTDIEAADTSHTNGNIDHMIKQERIINSKQVPSFPVSNFPDIETNNQDNNKTSNTHKDDMPGSSYRLNVAAIDPHQSQPVVDGIRVPQLLATLFRLTASFRSIDAVNHIVISIEKIVLALTTASGVASSARAPEILRDILSQPDFLPSMMDCLNHLFDRLRQVQLQDRINHGHSVVDDSDNHSVNSLIFSDTDTDMSGVESDGDTSSQHSTIFPNHPASSNSSNREEKLLLHIIGMHVKFLRGVMIQDMLLQSIPNRLWRDLFGSTEPTSAEVLLLICFDFVNNVRQYLTLSVDSILIIIDNMTQILNQVLEKVDVPIEFSVRVLHAIHMLHYHCPPDVRRKLQLNMLQQIRHEFILRIVLDRNEDIFVRTAAINDVKATLQAYLASNTSLTNNVPKPVPDSAVLISILILFLEAYADLEVIANEVHQTANANPISHSNILSSSPPIISPLSQPPSNPSSPSGYTKQSSSFDPAQVVEKIQALLDMMQNLIISLQTCVKSSPECKRLISKIMSDIPGDSDKLIFKTFVDMPNMPSNDQSTSSTSAISSTSEDMRLSHHVASSTTFRSPRMSLLPSMWSTVATNNRSITSSPVHSSDNHINRISDESIDPYHQTEQLLESSSHTNLTSFLDWYLAAENKSLHMHVRARVLKESKATQKVVEKYWERISQKKVKHQRLCQEKHAKDSLRLQKALKEVYDRIRANNDVRASYYLKEIESWYEQLLERVRLGKDILESQVPTQQTTP